METSLKPGFAQIFSCCPKNLSCPKSGGLQPPSPPWPVRLWLFMTLLKVNFTFDTANRLRLLFTVESNMNLTDQIVMRSYYNHLMLGGKE